LGISSSLPLANTRKEEGIEKKVRKGKFIEISQISSESHWDTMKISITPRRQHKGIRNCRSEGSREQLWEDMRQQIGIWSVSAGLMDFPFL